jgi:hypothetical protein
MSRGPRGAQPGSACWPLDAPSSMPAMSPARDSREPLGPEPLGHGRAWREYRSRTAPRGPPEPLARSPARLGRTVLHRPWCVRPRSGPLATASNSAPFLTLVLIRLRVRLTVRLDSAPASPPATMEPDDIPDPHPIECRPVRVCATLRPRWPSEGSRESRAVVG